MSDRAWITSALAVCAVVLVGFCVAWFLPWDRISYSARLMASTRPAAAVPLFFQSRLVRVAVDFDLRRNGVPFSPRVKSLAAAPMTLRGEMLDEASKDLARASRGVVARASSRDSESLARAKTLLASIESLPLRGEVAFPEFVSMADEMTALSWRITPSRDELPSMSARQWIASPMDDKCRLYPADYLLTFEVDDVVNAKWQIPFSVTPTTDEVRVVASQENAASFRDNY